MFLQLSGASLIHSDADRIPDDAWRRIWIGAGGPVLVVVTALVVARARRRDRTTFVLALVSPLLPFALWLLGTVLVAVYQTHGR